MTARPVTAEDCVASLKRWSARNSMGQKLALSLLEYKIVDPKTFQIVLKQKFGPLLEAIGKPSVVAAGRVVRRRGGARQHQHSARAAIDHDFWGVTKK